MNNYKIILGISLIMAFFITSCGDDDYKALTYSETDLVTSDAFVNVLTPVVSFVAGTESYNIDMLVVPGSSEIASLELSNSFTDSSTGVTSDPVAFKTYPVTGDASTRLQDVITYADLKNGLSGLPDSENDIAVGSSWDITAVAKNAAGEEVLNQGKITVAVLSPFAGVYRVIESDYYRIGAQSGAADWTGTEIFIGSVDENTFSHVNWWGPFDFEGSWVFDLNDDNTITIPDDPSQLVFSGDDMLTCQEDAGSFVNVPCAGSNVLEVAADGKHIIKLTYGYFTASGDENEGAREFYEVLEKIVE